MEKEILTDIDIKIMEYYRSGKELNGFEGVHQHLCDLGYLDGDLELTEKGSQYLKSNPKL